MMKFQIGRLLKNEIVKFWRIEFLIVFFWTLIGFTEYSKAQFRAADAKGNRAFVYHGRVLRPSGEAPTGSMQLTLKILSPEPGLCLLWSETQTVKIENGVFAVEVGHASNRLSGTVGGIAADFKEVFINNSSMALTGAQCAVGTSYSPTSADDRLLTASFADGGTAFEISNIPIKSVPFALQTEEIGGYGLANLMKISGVGSSVTFSPTETQSLKDLLGADLVWDLKNRKLTNVADPVANSDAATKGWVNSQIAGISGGGSGSVTSIVAGTGLTGGTITATGTINVDTGTTAGKIVQLDGSAKLPAVDGSALTNLNATNLATGTVAAARLPALSGDVTSSAGSASVTLNTVSTSKGGTGLTSVGTSNQVLGMNNAAGALEYKSVTAGSGVTVTHGANSITIAATGTGGTVTNVTGAAPISVATGTSTPAISISQASTSTPGYLSAADWNTFSGKQSSSLNAGLVWVGNASNVATARTLKISDVNSANTGAFLTGTTCSAGQALTYSAVTDTIYCDAVSVGSGLTGVVPVSNGGTGTSGGSITGTGALTFAAGGTNQSVRLTPSGTGSVMLDGNVGFGGRASIIEDPGDPNRYMFRNRNNDTGIAMTIVSNRAGGATNVGASFEIMGTDFLTDRTNYEGLRLTANEVAVPAVYQLMTLAGGTGSHRDILFQVNNSDLLRLTTTGKVGISQAAPVSKMDVNGGVTVGSGYSGVNAAPTDGLLVQGKVGVGTTAPNRAFHVKQATTGDVGLRVERSDTSGGVSIYNDSNGWGYLEGDGDLYLKTAYRNFYKAGGGGWGSSHIFVTSSPMTYAGSTTRFLDASAFTWAPTAGTGEFVGFDLQPTINQTGSASGNYTAFRINATETAATGTSKLLMDLQTNNVSKVVVASSGNVGIGTTNPGAPLEVKGAIRLSGSTSGYAGFQPAATAGSTVWTLPTADGSNGQFLSTNGSGVLSWSTPGGGSVTSIATGTGLTGGPITSTGTIALANIANNSVLGNTSGSAGAPTATTFATVFDTLLGSTQGTVAYRNGSGWTSLGTGTAGQVLTTQGASANPTWTTPTTGTVTNVTGTAPISVGTGTTTPAISISQATTSVNGYLSSTDWNTFNNKLGTSLNSGLVWVGNASNVATPRTLKISDIASNNSGAFLTGSTCSSGQALTYSAVTDTISCSAISVGSGLSGQVPVASGGTGTSTGSITGTGALTFAAGGTNQNINLVPSGTGITSMSGSVGIGTTAPNQQLEITAAMRMPATTDSLTGVVYKGANTFIHDYAAASTTGRNVFLGMNAGNFTMAFSSTANDASFNTGIGYNSLNGLTNGFKNTAVGYRALAADTTGTYNTAIGGDTLWQNTTGNQNTAVGQGALQTNTTGTGNTAVGINALSANTSTSNSAFGKNALLNNSTGGSNAAVGVGALQLNTTGGANAAMGLASLQNSTTGDYNTGLGTQSGMYNTTGSSNTFIGYLAGGVDAAGVSAGAITGSNNIIIGTNTNMIPNVGSSNQLNIGNLIFGTGLTAGSTVSSGNVGIGTTSPGQKLSVAGVIESTSGGIKFPDGTIQTTSAVSGTNNTMVSGFPDVIACSSGGSLQYLYLQYRPAGYVEYATPVDSGSSRSIIAYNNDGSYGSNSGLSSFDCATGSLSISQLYAAGRAFNFVKGPASQWLAGSSSAAYYNAGNVGIGTTSPGYKLEVSGSTKLGVPLNNGLLIQENDGTTLNGFLGPSGFGGFAIGTQSNDNVVFFSNNAERARLTAAGNFGIGTTSPSASLHVPGKIAAGSFEINGLGGQPSGQTMCYGTGGTVYGNTLGFCASLRKFKSEIVDLPIGMDQLMDLQPREYTWKASGKHYYGFIADEVEKVDPKLGSFGNDGKLTGVDNAAMISLLIKSVQELYMKFKSLFGSVDSHDREIASLKAETADLRKENAELKARMERLERAISPK